MTPRERTERALRLLADGNWSDGWREYEHRWDFSPEKPTWPRPMWDGDPNARVLVYPEQGHGDTIQFARYLPLLNERCASVVFLLRRPELGRLLQRTLADYGIPVVPDYPIGGFDAWCGLMSLPYLLDVLEPMPPTLAWRTRGIKRNPEYCGLCWRGAALHGNDKNRSIQPEALLPLKGRVMCSLQHKAERLPFDMPDALAGAKDFDDTACAIAGLGGVLTVDTSIAHLAGSLGVPTTILLPAVNTDWRWGKSGDATPWYPSVRLFRQLPGELWQATIERFLREQA